jgi:hypothetical protein
MNGFKETGPPVNIVEDGVYYYVFFPSDDTNCLLISPWGNVYGWQERLNPIVWPTKELYAGVGNNISFKDCPIGVKEAIMKEWAYQ